ncbi:MAG: membrane protein insertion efficiency factor YidD [Pseudomonadota bacterium]
MKWILIKLIRMYQLFLSPFLGRQCRFYPTCSEYGKQALQEHSSRKAVFLILKRLLNCHPLGKGGVDFVP